MEGGEWGWTGVGRVRVEDGGVESVGVVRDSDSLGV